MNNSIRGRGGVGRRAEMTAQRREEGQREMVSFGGELLTAAIAGAESSPAALRHVAELPAR
ncbi:MAG TPA: hypothetical protein PLI79_20180, partial [Mycobacterium sp.]|nr:hypothetical protein [Mycobacterium sp.]